ncbi:MAG: bifunctional phosphoribosylaminoimidazolecarboxamide formyltransferase/IMP cyclohydrolase, partial [Gemmatimonadetes bacterium]|nr:bifunctional phosphoribosylaminoimidazolecarboxamide formyltransferase/IMP cyclohydrolase [Gemmatimonadota bacterium]
MPRAILSVSDKRGVTELARGLVELGWEVLSTGGTARLLREAGVPVREVSEVTGAPELMEGRVKTLHPAIHAGILARRDRADDLAALEAQGYQPIDLVAVNLYPFARTVAAGAPLDEAMEQVDIGGPTLLRAAAKNHAGVLAVVDPDDYPRVLDALRSGRAGPGLRLELAQKVFAHTAAYDAAIVVYLARTAGSRTDAAPAARTGAPAAGTGGSAAVDEPARFPETLNLRLSKVQDLRYGENPDQAAAFYAEAETPAGALPELRQLQGKELSFNNLLDIDAAVLAVSAWDAAERAACVIVKHNTPCGAALGRDAEEAYQRALAADPVSAFGGIVAFNVPVTGGAAGAMASTFLEVVVAPDFEPHSLEVLGRKRNLRVIALPAALPRAEAEELDYKRVRGGMLVQQRLRMRFPEDTWRVVTRRGPSDAEWRDLRFAWRVAAAVRSNALVLAKEEQTRGIGAGQMSRLDAARIAVIKGRDQGHELHGAALGSDAFFPFRDGVD